MSVEVVSSTASENKVKVSDTSQVTNNASEAAWRHQKNTPKNMLSKRNSFQDYLEEAKGMIEDLEDDINADFAVSDCCMYVLFLVVFTSLTVVSRGVGSLSFFTTEAINIALTQTTFTPTISTHTDEATFNDVSDQSMIYDYLQSVLIPRTMVDTLPNGDPINETENLNLVAEQNKLLGGIHLRLKKSKQKRCRFENTRFDCYMTLESDSSESSKSITLSDGSVVKWNGNSRREPSWMGYVQNYDSGGFNFRLSSNKTEALRQLSILKESNILERDVRLLLVDFNTLNTNLGLHTVARLAFEMPISGGVRPLSEIKTWKFLRYDSEGGNTVFGLEVVFAIFVLVFSIEEMREIRSEGREYFRNRWNYLDLTNLIFFYGTIVIRIIERVHRMDIDFVDTTYYHHFQWTAWLYAAETYTQMVNGFLLYLKMFKYLTFSERMRFLFKMFNHSSTDLVVFTMVIFVFVLAFGMIGFLTFSQDVSDFRSFGLSVVNLIRFVVSDMDYSKVAASNRLIGSVFYCLWGVVVLLILANVFIAILSESYAKVAEEFDDDEDVLKVLRSTTKSAAKNAIGAIGSRISVLNPLTRKTLTVNDLDRDQNGLVETHEVLDVLSNQNEDQKEKLKRIIAQSDLNDDGLLNKKELKVLSSVLEAEYRADENRASPAPHNQSSETSVSELMS